MTADHVSPHELLSAFLSAHPDVRSIRWVIHDYHNVARTILTTTKCALRFALDPTLSSISGEPSILYFNWNVGLYEPDLLMYPGSDEFVPIWESLKMSSRGDQAMVVCKVRESKEVGEVERFDRDPRTVLERLERKAREEFGLEFKVGFEIEFQLLDSQTSTEAIRSTTEGVYVSSAIREAAFDVVTESVLMMEENDVDVWNFHPELKRGEYEIALAHVEPRTAVDNLIYAHDVIKCRAKQRGMHATMHPQYRENGPILGNHIHLSLSDPKLATSFLAGLLSHLSSISAILMGGYDSYLTPRAGTGQVRWGKMKCCPIRQVSETHFEVRIPDNLGNPYLQVAALIGSGLDGVRRDMAMDSDETTRDNMKADTEGKRMLPDSLAAAVQAMEADMTIKEILGEKCFDTYVWHRKQEVERVKGMTRAERSLRVVEHI